MAAHQWQLTCVLADPQQAEMISLTKCRLWSCRIVMPPLENLRLRWGYALVPYIPFWVSLMEESFHKICADAANDRVETTPSGSVAGHAGLNTWQPRLPEHHYHRWWVLGYDPETKAQSSQGRHSISPKPKKYHGKCTVMSKWYWLFSLTPVGVVYQQYAPQHQNVTKDYHLKILRCFCNAV